MSEYLELTQVPVPGRAIDRAHQMVSEAYAGNRIPTRWRVSRDIRDSLLPPLQMATGEEVARMMSFTFSMPGQRPQTTTYGDFLLGFPVVVDNALPERSMLLE